MRGPAVFRPGLLDDVAAASGHVLVQAGAGSGKTFLLEHLAEHVGRDHVVAFELVASTGGDTLRTLLRDGYGLLGRTTLASSVDAPTRGRHGAADGAGAAPVLLLIDGAGHLEEAAAAWLAAHVRGSGSSVRLVVAARLVPEPLRTLEFDTDVRWMTSRDLAFGQPEVERLLALRLPGETIPSDVVERLTARAAESLTLMSATIQRSLTSPSPVAALGELVRDRSLVDELMARSLGALTPDDRELLGQVAHLTVLTTTLVDAFGGVGTVARWLVAGLPVTALPDGKLHIPGALADRLRAGTSLSADTALLAAPLFVAGGQTRAAIAALFAAGEDAAVARMLTSLGRARLDDLTHPELLATTGRLAAAGVADARIRLLEARLLRELGRIDDQRQALEQALLAAPLDDAALRRSIEADQIAADLANGPTPERMAALDDLERRTPAAEMWSRATITTARAHALGWTNDARSQAESDLLFRQVTALWAGLGDPMAQADALRGWAIFVLMPGARYDAALRALRDAVALSGSAAFSRAQSLVFLAQAVAVLGDRDGARSTIAEARRLGQTAGIAWVGAYASWAELYVAMLDSDAAAIRHHSASAIGQLGQLENHPTRTIVLAETARALAQVGDVDGAAQHLALIPDDPEDPSESRALAQLTFDAMHGDPAEALVHAECLSSRRLLAPGQQWRIELLRALALARAGRHTDARAAHALAERVADDWGVGHLPDMMEPRVRRAIRTLLDDPGATDPAHGLVAVQALGSFVVRRGQQTVALAAGVPSTLVKLVASRGGSVSLDVAVEVLWPEVPTDVGRGRIRNVIARARELTGGAIERRGTSIAFIDSVELDVRRFEDAFRTVQRLRDEDPQQARSVARAALTTYDTLLADDLYEQWADEPRSTLRRRASALIDLVSADDLDAATGAWLAELVTGIDPFDDGRLIHLAGILTDNGAVSLASGLLQRAADIANELGATG